MKRKTGILIVILMFINLISIGFSAWNIVGTSPSNNDYSGTLEASDIVTSDFINNVAITKKLRYSKYGFIGDNGNKMTVKVDINLADCQRYLVGDKIRFALDLKYSTLIDTSLDIFKYIESTNVTANNDNYEVTKKEYQNNNYLIYIVIPYKEIDLDELSFDIEYVFENNDILFENNDSPLFLNDAQVFSFKSKLSLINEEVN